MNPLEPYWSEGTNICLEQGQASAGQPEKLLWLVIYLVTKKVSKDFWCKSYSHKAVEQGQIPVFEAAPALHEGSVGQQLNLISKKGIFFWGKER